VSGCWIGSLSGVRIGVCCVLRVAVIALITVLRWSIACVECSLLLVPECFLSPSAFKCARAAVWEKMLCEDVSRFNCY